MSATREASRELDALVAERVMGWKRVPVGPDYDDGNESEVLRDESHDWRGFTYPPRGKVALTYHCPNWSSDIAAAMLVVEAMRAKGYGAHMQLYRSIDPQAWRVQFPLAGSTEPTDVFHDSLPLAICLAAISALARASSGDSPRGE